MATEWHASAALRWSLPLCLSRASFSCDAYLARLGNDASINVVLIPQKDATAYVFGEDGSGTWQPLGNFNIGPDCQQVREALLSGNFQRVPKRLDDLQIQGRHIVIEGAVPMVTACRQ